MPVFKPCQVIVETRQLPLDQGVEKLKFVCFSKEMSIYKNRLQNYIMIIHVLIVRTKCVKNLSIKNYLCITGLPVTNIKF